MTVMISTSQMASHDPGHVFNVIAIVTALKETPLSHKNPLYDMQ